MAGSEECEIDLLAQSFAAMTLGRRPETERAMFTAYEKLFDRAHGILRLFTPAFDKTKQKVGYIRSYPPGIRENGGQYTHAAVWGAKAFFAIGRPDIGLQLINAINPAARCADPVAAAVYGAEPYVLSADVYAARGNEGRAGWSWYTGAAAWYYRVILEDALGVRFSDGLPPRNGGAGDGIHARMRPARRKSSHCLRRRRRDDAQRTALHLPRHAGGGRKRNHRPARRLMQKNCNNALAQN